MAKLSNIINKSNIDKSAGFENNKIERIFIDDIITDFDNIRTKKEFTALYMKSDIRELAESIIQYGLQNPITVTPEGKQYKIITGHRRFLAHYYLFKNKIKDNNNNEINTIKAIITKNIENIKEVQLIENIQREDLTDQEIETVILDLLNTGINQNEIATKISKSNQYVNYKVTAGKFRHRNSDIDTNKLTTNLIVETISNIKDFELQKKAINQLLSAANITIKKARQINEKFRHRNSDIEPELKNNDNKQEINNKNDTDFILDFNIKVDKQHNSIIENCNDTDLKELLQQTITKYYNKKT